jgi:methionine-rich copper-binding protein CopC
MRGLIVLAVLALLAAPRYAAAHAFLRSSEPEVGGTVTTTPTEVVIDFTEDVEPAFSHIVVKAADGAEVENGKAHAVPGHPARLAVALKPLPPGTYKVIWHATATDTHKTQGSFAFTVAK